MPKYCINTVLEFPVEVFGDFIPGTQEKYDKLMGGYVPGDPPEVKNLQVFLNLGEALHINIANFLDPAITEDVIQEIINEHFRSGGAI